jgi:hypothetical protein
LLKVIRLTETFRRRIILTVQGAPPFIEGLGQELTMITVMTGIFIVTSIGILVAHALEAFRSASRNQYRNGM